jgi:hypothetical protein
MKNEPSTYEEVNIPTFAAPEQCLRATLVSHWFSTPSELLADQPRLTLYLKVHVVPAENHHCGSRLRRGCSSSRTAPTFYRRVVLRSRF